MRLSWLKIYIGNLAVLNEQFRDENGAIDFAALGREEYEFRRAVIIGDFSRSERAREIYELCEEEFKARSDAGKKNANKRWNKTPSNNDTKQNATPADKQTVIDFATAEGLDVDDACECFYACNERGWETADGKPVKDWKSYMRKWCSTRKRNRRKAG